MSLNIATAPVNWNNDDVPGWRAPEPFPELLDRMVEAGYRATEYDDKIGPEPDTVGRAARERGLELCGFYQWLDLQDDTTLAAELPELERRLAQLGNLGCQHLIIADRLRPERDAIAGRVPADRSVALPGHALEALVERADRVASIAAQHGFQTHYHNHVGTYVESPEEVAEFARIAQGRAIDFCFDTGHYAYAGGDAFRFISDHIDSIGHLHLKDVDARVLTAARTSGASFRDALRQVVFAPLGEGDANIPAIVSTLVKVGFRNWVVIEQDTCRGDATETARKNLDTVHTLVVNRIADD
jgi:inosose dehydratase